MRDAQLKTLEGFTNPHQGFRKEGKLSIVCDPRMTHDCYEAHPGFWVLVQQPREKVLEGITDEDVIRKLERSFADLLIEPKDGV